MVPFLDVFEALVRFVQFNLYHRFYPSMALRMARNPKPSLLYDEKQYERVGMDEVEKFQKLVGS